MTHRDHAGGIVLAASKRVSAGLAAAALLALAACGGGGSSALPPPQAGPAPTFQGQTPSGFVDLHEVQVAYIGNAGGGAGTLAFRGNVYPFKIDGLGVGGIGISTVDAQGEVYGLTSLSQFPGAYAAGQYGAVVGSASVGDIWLKNQNNVVLHLKAKREGLMLSVGADVININMLQ